MCSNDIKVFIFQLDVAQSDLYLEEEVERCRDDTRAASAPLRLPNVLRRPGIVLNQIC